MNAPIAPAAVTFNAADLAAKVNSAILGQEAFRVGRLATIEAFKGLTFDAWNGRHKMVVDALVSGGFSANTDSATRMLNRMLDDCGLTKPKSESADATKKAEQRKAEAAKIETLIKSEKVADLQKKAQKGDTDAAKAIAQIAQTAKKQNAEKVKGLLTSIRSELAKADESTLRQIAKLLGIEKA